jgi:serine protease
MHRLRALAGPAASIGLLLWLATPIAPLAQGAGPLRTLLQEIGLPGIDRGLRNLDAPRPPADADEPQIEVETASDLPYANGSVIVRFRPGTALVAQRAMLAFVDGGTSTSPSYANFDIVALAPGTDPEAAALRLSAQPDVEYAQARYRIRPRFVPNDPLYAQQWNYPAIDMERAWDINPSASSSITVAVIDSGVAYRSGLLRFQTVPFRLNGVPHPSLGAVDVPFAGAPDLGGPGRVVAPRDFIWDDELALDFSGHGTHVAGTIGQLTNNGVGAAGMASGVRIMPIKVISGPWDVIFDNQVFGSDDLVARGIRYAVDNGANVLNMSIGRTGPAAPVIRDALLYATSRGAFVAIAAGNDFLNGNPIERPADSAPEIEGVVAVGAVGRDRARARYSSTGAYVELSAPGGDVSRGGQPAAILQQTLAPDFTDTFLFGPAGYRAPRFDVFEFRFNQGTSMAAPHVSGFAALLMQQGITSPAAIEAAMKRYATDLGTPGPDNEYGHGLINPRAALRGMGLAR